jgi:hypothetical protein
MIVLAPSILLVSSLSYLYIHICKIVNCPVELPGQVPVPDIHNCPVSACAKSAKNVTSVPRICECFAKLGSSRHWKLAPAQKPSNMSVSGPRNYADPF